MAIRPTIVGPLLDGVSALTTRGYLRVETFTSTVDPDPFYGADPGAGARIYTNGSIKGRLFTYLRTVNASTSNTLALTQSAVAANGVTEDVDQTVTLTQDVTVEHDIPRTLSSTLTTSQSVSVNIVSNQSVSNTISPTQQLNRTIDLSVDNTLSLTDTSDYEISYFLSSDVTVGQTVTCNVVRTFSLSDDVPLGHGETDQNLEAQELIDAVDLVQTVDGTVLGLQQVSDILTLVQTVYDASASERNVSQMLTLSQSLRWSPRREEISQTLSLSQTVRQALILAYASHALSLTETVRPNIERTISVSSSLTMTDRLRGGTIGTASNDLTLTQTLVQSKGYYNTLTLTDSLELVRAKLLTSTLVLSATATPNLVVRRTTEQDLALSQNVIGIKNTPSTCLYDPISSVLPAAPTLTKQSTVTYECGADSLTLKAPQIGDQEDRKYQQTITETLGGALRVYRRITWPKTKTLSYSFEDLCESNVTEILEFLSDSLGKEVTLTDYYGRSWVGVITNPDAQYVSSGRGIGTITIVFEGEPV